MNELIQGREAYSTTCGGCGHVSVRDSTILDLDLPVTTNTLNGCLKSYFVAEQLRGDNK